MQSLNISIKPVAKPNETKYCIFLSIYITCMFSKWKKKHGKKIIYLYTIIWNKKYSFIQLYNCFNFAAWISNFLNKLILNIRFLDFYFSILSWWFNFFLNQITNVGDAHSAQHTLISRKSRCTFFLQTKQ